MLERSLQFVHVPAPKHRDDHESDQLRTAATSKAVSHFSIETKCGWGRGNPARASGLLDSRRIALEGR